MSFSKEIISNNFMRNVQNNIGFMDSIKMFKDMKRSLGQHISLTFQLDVSDIDPNII